MFPKSFLVLLLTIVSAIQLYFNDRTNFGGDLIELNLAADNIVGPLLTNLIFLKLQSLLSKKIKNHEIVRMRTPDKTFRTIESNNMSVYTRKF